MGSWKDKDKQREWHRRRYKERTRFILKYKTKHGGCKKCGYNTEPGILVFHHRDPKIKKSNINSSWMANCSFDKLMIEIKKCDILCPNCHSLFHYKNRS